MGRSPSIRPAGHRAAARNQSRSSQSRSSYSYWARHPRALHPSCCCRSLKPVGMCSPTTTLLHSTKHYSQMHTVHSNLTTFDAFEPQLELWDLSPHFCEPQLEHWDLFPSTFEHTGSLLTQSRSSFAATKSIPPAIRAGARSGFSPSVVVASPLVITSSSLAIQRFICAPRPSPGALRLVESFYIPATISDS